MSGPVSTYDVVPDPGRDEALSCYYQPEAYVPRSDT